MGVASDGWSGTLNWEVRMRQDWSWSVKWITVTVITGEEVYDDIGTGRSSLFECELWNIRPKLRRKIGKLQNLKLGKIYYPLKSHKSSART